MKTQKSRDSRFSVATETQDKNIVNSGKKLTIALFCILPFLLGILYTAIYMNDVFYWLGIVVLGWGCMLIYLKGEYDKL